jgi:hypothetical protein
VVAPRTWVGRFIGIDSLGLETFQPSKYVPLTFQNLKAGLGDYHFDPAIDNPVHALILNALHTATTSTRPDRPNHTTERSNHVTHRSTNL